MGEFRKPVAAKLVNNLFSKGVPTMSKPAAKPIPDGFHTATPHLVCANAAEAIEFYKKAFNAVEIIRLPGPDGKLMHGCIRIGDSFIMLADEFPDYGSLGPKSLKGSPVTMHLYVKDPDAVAAQAVAAGATVVMPVGDAFWGDRYGQVEDPFGHRWAIAAHKFEMTPEEITKAMMESMPGMS